MPVARPRAQGKRADAIGDRVLQARDDARMLQNVHRVRCHPARLGGRKVAWRDQTQVLDAHGLHGARRSADVARVARPAQHDADALQALFAHARKCTQCVTLKSLMHPLLNIAIKAARRAGSVINRAALDGSALEVRAKQANDFVTQVDRAAERAAIEVIRRACSWAH